ncbi:MAG TPA: hypothetical protein VNL15_01875 [Dehalococcoidia bacterium]|nr:hypothetical protein [Dehalococcoidia bacterium]
MENSNEIDPTTNNEAATADLKKATVSSARSASIVAEALRRMSEQDSADEDSADGLLPVQPRSFTQLGLSRAFLTDLTLKIIHYSGTPTAAQIGRRMGISPSLVQQIVSLLNEEGLLEMMSQADLYSGSYRYRLTSRGSERVHQALERSRYAGPVPVTAETYTEVMKRHMARRQLMARWRIKESLSGLVLSEDIEDALGRALYSGRSVLLFGPSGNGKTKILQGFSEQADGVTIVPYAIYAHGQIIRIFDPSMHVPVEDLDEMPKGREERVDRRWVLVKRPVVILATELGPESLELAYDPVSHFYQAPPHIKVQNGVLIVDDLGRNKMEASAVLSRWLISLERGWDTLTLATGEKMTVPFRAQFLLATNLPVRNLADEALLRRIPYKIEVPSPSAQNFARILKNACEDWHIKFNELELPEIVERLYNRPGFEVRAAHAHDLAQIILESAHFDGREPELNRESFEKALELLTNHQESLA